MAGSIEKRGENTYRLVVSGGKNLDGTRYKKTKTIHGTRKDAKIALAEFITEVNRGLVPEGKSITFEEFFYIWDEKYKRISTKNLFKIYWNIKISNSSIFRFISFRQNQTNRFNELL